MSRVHMVSFCDLIGTVRARRQKMATFPADVTRLSHQGDHLKRERLNGHAVALSSNKQTQVACMNIFFPLHTECCRHLSDKRN